MGEFPPGDLVAKPLAGQIVGEELGVGFGSNPNPCPLLIRNGDGSENTSFDNEITDKIPFDIESDGSNGTSKGLHTEGQFSKFMM